jgi:hypothetical protein
MLVTQNLGGDNAAALKRAKSWDMAINISGPVPLENADTYLTR